MGPLGGGVFVLFFLNLYFDWVWVSIVFLKVAERISVGVCIKWRCASRGDGCTCTFNTSNHHIIEEEIYDNIYEEQHL